MKATIYSKGNDGIQRVLRSVKNVYSITRRGERLVIWFEVRKSNNVIERLHITFDLNVIGNVDIDS